MSPQSPLPAKIASLRVLYVDHTSEPGGGELALASLLEKSTHDLRVFLFEDGVLADRSRAAGRATTIARSRGLVGRLGELRRRIASNEEEILVANSLRSALYLKAASLGKRHYVIYLRDGIDKASLSPLRRLMARWALSSASDVLVNSQWTEAQVLSTLPRARTHVIYTVSNVRAAEFVDPSTSQDHVQPMRVVFVGRMVPWKGPDVLLNALARAEEQLGPRSISTTFCGAPIMGDSAFFDELKKRSSDLGLDTDFVGQVDVGPYLRQADVFVHASTRPEPFGQVIVQACAAGLCVLASDEGGPSEILRGLPPASFFAISDSIDLAERLIHLYRNPHERRELASQASEAGARFTDEKMVDLHDSTLSAIGAS